MGDDRTVHWPDERDARRRSGVSLEPMISPRRLAACWGVEVQTIYRDMPGGDLRIRVTDARRYGKPVR